MSLKKRMFRSNMTILFLALLAQILVVVFVLFLFEDSFEKQFHETEQEIMRQYSEPGQALESGISDFFQESFVTVLGSFFLISVGVMAIVLVLSAFFTRKMNRVVMEPLEKLLEGANRIKDGNLGEEIQYQGEEEFENVCHVFNSMQRTILKDQQERIKNEKARTDMVTGISHDLRTPLTSIQGYIKGVLDHVADTPQKRENYLRTAYESTEEMNILLQKLFDFSRMESGQMPFHMVKADLAEFAASYVAQKKAVMDEKQIQFTFIREQEIMPEISVDVEQIRRVFDNLLENSLKYSSVQPVQVEIRISMTKTFVILVWKDNGKGVPEEKLSRIFERFYRCDEARSEKGSGVGLYVVESIIKRHHGSITAQNENGLKFTITFFREALE